LSNFRITMYNHIFGYKNEVTNFPSCTADDQFEFAMDYMILGTLGMASEN